MSFRILVFVGLRVYAIYFAVQIVAMIPLIAPMLTGGREGSWVLIEPAGMLLVSLILWITAGRIAAAVVREIDPAIDKFTFSLENAYTFAFVFLGLYFILSSIASTLQQVYYLVAVVAQLSDTDPQRAVAFFQLYKPGITLVAGFASLLGAPFWAQKLMAFGPEKRR